MFDLFALSVDCVDFLCWNADDTLCCAVLVYSSNNPASDCEQDSLGLMCLSWSCVCSPSAAGYAERQGLRNIFLPVTFASYLFVWNNDYDVCWCYFFLCRLVFITIIAVNSLFKLSDCWTFHSTLCFCTRSCKVLELCTLGPPGLSK